MLACKAMGLERFGDGANLVGLKDEAVDSIEVICLANTLGIGNG